MAVHSFSKRSNMENYKTDFTTLSKQRHSMEIKKRTNEILAEHGIKISESTEMPISFCWSLDLLNASDILVAPKSVAYRYLMLKKNKKPFPSKKELKNLLISIREELPLDGEENKELIDSLFVPYETGKKTKYSFKKANRLLEMAATGQAEFQV